MKIKDVITNPSFYVNTRLGVFSIQDDSKIVLNFPDIQPDEDVEFVYYWYDHLTRGSQAVEDIENSLKEHNWHVFSKYYFDEIKHECDLPCEIVVFSTNTSDLIGHMRLNENTFNLITYAEYECG